MSLEAICLALMFAGVGWMVIVLLMCLEISVGWTWPPVQLKLGRSRRSTWAQVLSDPTQHFV